jgi:ligand-binding sensor domain-containing protein
MIWVRSFGNTLDRYDWRTDRFTRYRNDPSNPRSLGGRAALAWVEAGDGTVWVGTEQGLERYDRASDGFEHYRHDPANPHSLGGKSVTALVAGRDGALWVLTEAGLDRFDPARGMFEHVASGDSFASQKGVPSRMLQDQSGAL